MSPAQKEQDIVVQITKNFDGMDANISRLRKLIKTVCIRFRLLKATVGVAILNDAEIRKLNKEFLNRDTTTDCLSFNLSDDKNQVAGHKDRSQKKKNILKSGCSAGGIFELVVNGEMAVKEASARGHSGEAELALYVVHGLLHNLGFDDATKAQAKKMHDTEDEILQELGYGLVYNKDTKA